ncbi:hypothetical protein ACL6C3_15105 [Capilliphycus salinus ALCB114379]|uniref:hypothetical protein n=1 Tax=Capilliphycus salinus TaxID=2768948 RepID=UPI0039A569B8
MKRTLNPFLWLAALVGCSRLLAGHLNLLSHRLILLCDWLLSQMNSQTAEQLEQQATELGQY